MTSNSMSSSAGSNSPQSKRVRFLINPTFQTRVIGSFLFLAVTILAIWFLTNYYFFWELVRKGQELNLPMDHIYFRFIETQRQNLIRIISVVSLFVGLGVVFFGMRFSHRIAGPIYGIGKQLTRIRERQEVQHCIRIRADDYFPELAQEINSTFVALGHLSDSNQK